MNPRSIRLALTLPLLVSFLAACAQSSTSPTSVPATSGPAATSAPAATAQGPVTIRVITQFGVGAEPQPLLDEEAAAFTKDHPNIKVVFDWTGGGEFTQKYRAQLAAGTPYDILWHNEGTTAVLAREGVSVNITKYLDEMNYEGDKVWKDSFVPAILQRAWIADGKDGPGYYSVPNEQFIKAIVYNKAMLQQYNIQVPKTWDDFLSACETLKTNGIACIADDGNIGYYNAMWFVALAMRQVGCDVFYNTAMNKPGTSFNTPDFLQVAKNVAALRDKGYLLKGYEGSAFPAAQAEFVQGKAAMMMLGSWAPGEMQSTAPTGFQYGFFAFPSIPGSSADPTTVELKFNGWIVTKDAPHHDEAMLFIKYLLSRPAQEAYTNRVLYPGVLPGLKMPAILADAQPILENSKTVVGYTCGMDRDKADWEDTVLIPLDDKLFFGQLTPQDFITQLQQAHVAFWAKQ